MQVALLQVARECIFSYRYALQYRYRIKIAFFRTSKNRSTMIKLLILYLWFVYPFQ